MYLKYPRALPACLACNYQGGPLPPLIPACSSTEAATHIPQGRVGLTSCGEDLAAERRNDNHLTALHLGPML